ncbi:hypothetical protein PVAG01_04492 [Phlyctema vagabunda]|uniref:Heterokaryon incompatibility domain-containing protein n=1 Tax=Phlyctema vagabunda TaxID=108571 RepID=A0ABR4PQN1_9HELO
MSTDHVNEDSEAPRSKEVRVQTDTNGTARDKKLCATCQRLDLSMDKFVIYSGRHTQFRQGSRSSKFALRSGTDTHEVGCFREIQARSETCSFCYLVLMSIERPEESRDANGDGLQYSLDGTPDDPNPEAICYVNWEIDGRENNEGFSGKARTRRLHLHWSDKSLKDSYLVYVAPQRLFDFNSDSQGSWDKEAFFLGRELRPDCNNQVLMKSWLDQCHEHHGQRCSGDQDHEFMAMAEQSYFGVIDVLDMCLKSLPRRSNQRKDSRDDKNHRSTRRRRSPSPPSLYGPLSDTFTTDNDGRENIEYEPYVALSYVWGTRKNYTTEISNVRVHQQQGSLETFFDKIPLVIRDAMHLVRRLGLRYLWVDSLCIVQDSKRSWNLNSRVMDLIYGNAYLTICAADGNDAWFGLKALDDFAHIVKQHIVECAPGVRLMVSQLAETGINASKWNTRAWTFQERLLSRRCLIFTEGRVFFQCRSATMSEDLVSVSQGAGWSLDLAKALPQILHELDRRPIRVYMNCMARYSERKLTQSQDILAAFNGVSNMISKVMRAPFIFGLPSSHFDLALLWEPLIGVTRRVQEPGQDFRDLTFPSWSWCGWKGGPTEYSNSQLEGVLINLHEWLKEHTWIAWYIRDGRGNLRPVWDGKISETCDSTEERWRGYKAVSPDKEFKDLQAEAQKCLGNPNEEDDFLKWAKEQEQNNREVTREVVRHNHREHNHREHNHREHHHREGRMADIYYERPEVVIRRIGRHSPSPVRNRYEEQASIKVERGERSRTFQDEYGREIPFNIARRLRGTFQQCLPDNPFRVYIEDYTAKPDKDFPDQPLLQFWTWWAALRVVQSTTDTSNRAGLKRYDIADEVGDWCGSIMLDEQWVAKREKNNGGHKFDGSKCDFLAISDAKAFTTDECDVWTYYVPKERQNSEWDLYYVLLVEQKDRIWSRVALGKVFKAAFENAVMPKRWREIILG